MAVQPAFFAEGGVSSSGWVGRALASWAYPTSGSRRDLRIDLLRGLCVFAMLADHLGGDSWLYVLTGGNRGFVSAAEGFIFISGLMVGQVYGARIVRVGLWPALLHTLRRARTLYIATVVMTLIFTALRIFTDISLWVPRSVGSAEQSPVELIVATVTLHHTYHGTDILAMYVFCLIAAGAALALLASGHWKLVLAGSWLVWLGYQLRPEEVLVPWYIRNSENFPLAAWQVLFMTALVIGYHRRHLTNWIDSRPRIQLGLVGAALVACMAVTWLFQVSGDEGLEVFAKVPLRPARLIGFAGAAMLAYTFVTLAWEPLRRALGWLLLPLGQHALYCYVVHFFLIVLLINALPGHVPQVDWLSPVLLGTLLQLGLVVAVWSLVQRRVLFGVVPD